MKTFSLSKINTPMLKLTTIVILFILSTTGCKKNKIVDSDEEVVVTPPTVAPVYELLWADEFNGTTLDMNNWSYDVGYNLWGNNEQENYQAANVSVAAGNLQILAKKEKIGSTPSDFTSGRIHTLSKREYMYGKIEAKMKLPKSKGMWPAFWMLGVNMRARGATPGVGWPACGEIDIMETINSEIWTSAAAHWATPNGSHTNKGNRLNIAPNDWHVYSVEWNTESIKWFVDGKFYHAIWIKDGAGSTSEFHAPFNIILNLAVGGDWAGQVIDETKLPATMLVDYVRVYKEVK
jgi:beta-glucanase (GH16 family)